MEAAMAAVVVAAAVAEATVFSVAAMALAVRILATLGRSVTASHVDAKTTSLVRSTR
jgi:hypothetical protein